MIPVLHACEADASGHTGTATVATVFLAVFSLLIAFDAYVTSRAIQKTLAHTHVVHYGS